MSLPMAAAVFVLAALASPAALADLYKCQQDGRTTYQERPCTEGSNESRMSGVTGWAVQWVGCYESPPKGPGPVKVTRDLRVRSAGGGLFLDVEGSAEAVPVRRMTREELQIMERGMAVVSGGDRYVDGLAIPRRPEERAGRNDAVHGIYRVIDRNGREELRVSLPTVGYTVRKGACKSW